MPYAVRADDAEAEVPSYWDIVADEWEEMHPQTLWRAYSDRLHTAWLRRSLPAGCIGRVLKTDLFDEAYSEGLFPLLAARAQRVVGLDLSTSVLDAARKRHPVLQGVQGDIRNLPFPDASFDVVVSNSTLDHFESLDDIRLGLREIRRVLRSDGRLLLTLDNAANPLLAMRNALPFRLLNRLGLVPYYVGATCGPRRLRAMLYQVGFHAVEEHAMLHCPRVLAVRASQILERYASVHVQQHFLRFLMRFERLSRWPTRFLTGYFITVKAM